jgi:ferredoxin
MAITKVWIEEGCAASGLCSSLCPQVFVLKDLATVTEGINYSDYEQNIKEAAENCPTEVIRYSEDPD